MTTITKITRLSAVLLISAVLVLSSIAAAQLFVTDNNAAFAEEKCSVTETDGTLEEVCIGGEKREVGGGLRKT